MGYPLPADARLKGSFRPTGFEVPIEECIVSQGEIALDGLPLIGRITYRTVAGDD